MSLNVATLVADGAAYVTLAGELDVWSELKLDDALRSVERRHPTQMLVDLTGLTFADATGPRLLQAANERARREHRSLAVLQGPAQVHQVFCLAGLEGELNFVCPGDLEDEAE
ncbi:MAG: STAS domain-containing protein [Actinomycetota bacterium]